MVRFRADVCHCVSLYTSALAVRGVASEGCGKRGDPRPCTCLINSVDDPTVPDAVTSLSYTVRAQNRLEVSWNINTNRPPQGFNISYEPLYSIRGAVVPGEGRVDVVVEDADVRVFTLEDLEAHLGYRVEVAAYNSAGTSATVTIDTPRT